MTSVTLIGGERLVNVHDPADCWGQRCAIHRTTDHHMKDWPQHFGQVSKIMYRICEHDVLHPDPDDWSVHQGTRSAAHDCDGCCQERIVTDEEFEEYRQKLIGQTDVS